MIRRYKITDYKILNNLVRQHYLENVYLYIDSQTYGFENENIRTWLLVDNTMIKGIIYEYYNSLQLLQVEKASQEELIEICQHIHERKYEMISGNIELLKALEQYFQQEYKLTSGCIMQCKKYADEISGLTYWADRKHCHEIAELICSDNFIGGHYTVELLENQLVDRMDNWNCKNLVIMESGKIVSHMATYADDKKIAILGGLVTAPKCRGKGYGKKILSDIAYSIKEEGKIPVLYCYNEKLIEWYKKQGWFSVSDCGKLERVR